MIDGKKKNIKIKDCNETIERCSHDVERKMAPAFTFLLLIGLSFNCDLNRFLSIFSSPNWFYIDFIDNFIDEKIIWQGTAGWTRSTWFFNDDWGNCFLTYRKENRFFVNISGFSCHNFDFWLIRSQVFSF